MCFSFFYLPVLVQVSGASQLRSKELLPEFLLQAVAWPFAEQLLGAARQCRFDVATPMVHELFGWCFKQKCQKNPKYNEIQWNTIHPNNFKCIQNNLNISNIFELPPKNVLFGSLFVFFHFDNWGPSAGQTRRSPRWWKWVSSPKAHRSKGCSTALHMTRSLRLFKKDAPKWTKKRVFHQRLCAIGHVLVNQGWISRISRIWRAAGYATKIDTSRSSNQYTSSQVVQEMPKQITPKIRTKQPTNRYVPNKRLCLEVEPDSEMSMAALFKTKATELMPKSKTGTTCSPMWGAHGGPIKLCRFGVGFFFWTFWCWCC